MRHSVYLHVPFCTHRCAYCDFTTYAGQERSIPAYVSALCAEVDYVGNWAPEGVSVHTIFFGGGTPSLLLSEQVGLVLATIRRALPVEEAAEVTLEANPGTVSPRGLQTLRAAGINRISLGVQSANGEELRMLERAHNYGDVLDAVSGVRRAGFDNLNTDLIYGLPGQTMYTWQTTVRRVLDLRPDHFSAYALTLEHGTPFGRWSSRGLLSAPDPDRAADMYEWLSYELQTAGYEQYEISNWAHPGRECLHNLQYWRGGPYLGFGAGAHGYAGGYRYSNMPAIRSYTERFSQQAADERGTGARTVSAPPESVRKTAHYPCSPAVITHHRQSTQDDIGEFMITGLRLTKEGVSANRFQRRFGTGLLEMYGREIPQLTQSGLLEWTESKSVGAARDDQDPGGGDDQSIRLTTRGRLLGNRVFAEFLSPAAVD